MFPGDHLSNSQVLTDHRGWPVAVNEGAVWWMVAEVEPAECPTEQALCAEHLGEVFRLLLTNGQVLIAVHNTDSMQWSIARRDANETSETP
ncbi:MAG: hypothetical protein WD645_03495 [Dehalococcoidia bacterium]